MINTMLLAAAMIGSGRYPMPRVNAWDDLSEKEGQIIEEKVKEIGIEDVYDYEEGGKVFNVEVKDWCIDNGVVIHDEVIYNDNGDSVAITFYWNMDHRVWAK